MDDPNLESAPDEKTSSHFPFFLNQSACDHDFGAHYQQGHQVHNNCRAIKILVSEQLGDDASLIYIELLSTDSHLREHMIMFLHPSDLMKGQSSIHWKEIIIISGV